MNLRCWSPFTKKNWLNRGIKTGFVLVLAVLSIDARAADDPNLLLGFKKLYLSPPQDNLDGVFKAPIADSYKTVFEKNPRFELVGSPGEADSILRTQVEQKRNGTVLEITLAVLNPSTKAEEIFTTEKTNLPNEVSEKALTVKARELLKVILKRIPFYGSVTGRDADLVTMDIGSIHGLKQGDVIQISRVDSFKKHPMLKSIVDVQMVPVGSVEIDVIEPTIAFGKIKEELTGEQVQRLYKVTAIEAKPKDPLAKSDSESESEFSKEKKKTADFPKYGFISTGLFLGSLSAGASVNNGTFTTSGSGFHPGARVLAELWLSKNFFVDFTAAGGVASIKPKVEQGGALGPALSTNTLMFGADIGYRYFLTGSLFGPQAFLKAGYQSFSWKTPATSDFLMGSKSYKGLNIGFGGSMPLGGIRSGLLMNINFMLFASLTETGVMTAPESYDRSNTVVGFFAGGYYFILPRLAARAGLQIDVYATDFQGEAQSSSVSIKEIGVLPSLVYYF